MEKGRGKVTDTLQTDNVFTRKEYIEREKLRDELYEADAITMRGVVILNQLPAADVVPVVRCGECKHRTSGNPNCVGRNKNWYCPWGEKRDDND